MLNNEIQKLIALSKYAGERLDLIQAGGGNSSVKLSSGEMLIKASGRALSEMSTEHGYIGVNLSRTIEIINKIQRHHDSDKKKKELLATALLKDAIWDSQNTERPSIETFLHALMDTYTLHTHPIAVNIIACQKNWKEVFTQLVPDGLCVPYATPGIELALSLKDGIDLYSKTHCKQPAVIFFADTQ